MKTNMANVKVGIFNNKGGVGKTTYLYHIAHILSDKGYKVLMVDCDTQCNLTAYSMTEKEIEESWSDGGNSVFRGIKLISEGMGDIVNIKPHKVDSADNLYLIPGDLELSGYEDKLGDGWNSARGGDVISIRQQSAIVRLAQNVSEKIVSNIILFDLGPNMGSLNRSIIGGCDYIVVPTAPDLFSIRGTENLGNKLEVWEREWGIINSAYGVDKIDFEIPKGRPKFIGYVVQQHNRRAKSETGMTKGWSKFGGGALEKAIQENLVEKLRPCNRVVENSTGNFKLGNIPNLHTLIAYSQSARKPVYKCDYSDGLRGAHITDAKNSVTLFDDVVESLISVIDK